jgi:hypothetical protein
LLQGVIKQASLDERGIKEGVEFLNFIVLKTKNLTVSLVI